MTDRTFSAYYRNYRGEVSWRTITPMEIWYGTTEYHTQPQWFLKAQDHQKQAIRDFALADFLGDNWTEINTEDEYKELSRRAANIGYQLCSDEQVSVLGASLTVGNGLVVYGTIEALGRVQNYILMSSKHPVEASDTKRQLARALASTEAQLMAANDKIEELTKLLMQSKTA